MSKRACDGSVDLQDPKRFKTSSDTLAIVLGENINYSRAGQYSNHVGKILITTRDAIKECDCKDFLTHSFEDTSIDGTMGNRRICGHTKRAFETIEKLISHEDSHVIDPECIRYCMVATYYGDQIDIPWLPAQDDDSSDSDESLPDELPEDS